MKLKRNRLYIFLILLSTAGYVWLFLNYSRVEGRENTELGVCLIKHTTNIPCPSCGSTRSAISLLNGNINESLYWNPIGIILIVGIVFIPIWILLDLFLKRDTFYKNYIKFELLLKQKRFAIPAIFLVLLNWVWNIYKGL